jgi:hypothetical protein
MNAREWHDLAVRKVAQYDWYTCRRAMIDCHDTLSAQGADIADDYAIKLWAEIDALRERQLEISK